MISKNDALESLNNLYKKNGYRNDFEYHQVKDYVVLMDSALFEACKQILTLKGILLTNRVINETMRDILVHIED